MKIRQLIASTLFALIFGLMASMGAALADTAEETFAKAVAAVHAGDDEQAIIILEPLANAGDVKGMSLLGQLILGEADDESGKKKAREWMLKAAEAGDPNAMAEYAYIYFTGKEPEIEKTKIKNFLINAAEKGHPQAQFLLGTYYWIGSGFKEIGDYFEKDIIKSKYWAEKALSNGELSAKETLFVIENYPIRLEDLAKVNLLAEVIALSDQGYLLPSFIRGQLYMGNSGAANEYFDIYKAAQWFTIAVYINHGHEEAEEYLKEIRKVIGQTSELSDAWFREHATDEGTRYGISAKWCVRQKGSDIHCLRNAISNYMSCHAPYFPGYFDDYIPSLGYDRCRNKQLEEQSLDLM